MGLYYQTEYLLGSPRGESSPELYRISSLHGDWNRFRVFVLTFEFRFLGNVLFAPRIVSTLFKGLVYGLSLLLQGSSVGFAKARAKAAGGRSRRGARGIPPNQAWPAPMKSRQGLKARNGPGPHRFFYPQTR